MAAVCRALTQARVHVLIRPRPGDFLYSAEELQASRAHGMCLAMLCCVGQQMLPLLAAQ